jgi:lysozyme
MKASNACLEFIAAQEGFRADAYFDVAGVWTIGFGHVIRYGDPISATRDQALVILRHDMASAESAVNADVRVVLSQRQFDALVSFAFNAGTGALAISTLLGDLNKGDYAAAADQFLVWDHARVNGQLVEVEGLKRRRVAERAMFLTPDAAGGVETQAPVTIADAPPVLPDEGQPTPPGDLPPTVET